MKPEFEGTKKVIRAQSVALPKHKLEAKWQSFHRLDW